jgi:hypothetical protein
MDLELMSTEIFVREDFRLAETISLGVSDMPRTAKTLPKDYF